MKSWGLYLTIALVTSTCWAIEPSDLKGSKVKYVSPSQAKDFPVPAIDFRSPGLVTKERRAEIITKIVTPMIRETGYPISAVIVELFRDHLNEYVGIEVVSSVHPMNSGLIYFEKDGTITDELFRQWFAHENDEGEDRN